MPFDRMVGEAYILMRADGTLIPRDIKNVGKKAGKGYAKEFDKELKAAEKGSIARFRRTLAQATADIDFSRFRKEFGDVDNTVRGVKARLKEMRNEGYITAKAAKRVREELNQWARAERGVAAAAKDISDRNKSLKQFFRDQEVGLKRISKARVEEQRLIAKSNAAYETYARNIQFSLTRTERALEEQNRAWLTYGRNVEFTNTRQQRALEEQNKAWATYGRNLVAATRRLEDHTDSLVHHSNRWVTASRKIRLGLDRATVGTDRFGILVGRAFGKGSRNNFLNWVGSMVGGLTRLSIGVFTFPARAVAHVGDSFGTAFSAARLANMGKFASTIKGLSAVVGGPQGLVAALVGVAGGAFVLGKVLPGIISLLSMVGGVAVSITGSIGIGLTGALLAVTPAVIGAAAGFGTLFGVFTQFFRDDKNAKFVKNFLEPFREMNKSYYPQVKKFLTNIRGGFDDFIKDIRPSIDSFFAAFDKGTKKRKPGVLADPSTTKALAAWSDSIGKISLSMSRMSTSALSGLIGFFKPVLPYAERLASYLERVAQKFDEWANSAKGQNSISEFMGKAWIAADKVWRILGNIGGIIGDVFMGGEQTGTGFLNDILLKLQEINTFLSTPEGQKKMRDWFGDVKQIGRDIGNLALDIGKIIAEFNSPEGRANAVSIMNAIKGIGDAAVKVAEVADSIGKIVSMLNPLKQVFNLLNGGKSKPDPGTPQTVKSGPSVQQLQARKVTQDALTKYALTLKVTPQLDQKALNAQLAAIEAYKSTGVQIPIKGNEDLWNQTKGTIAMTIFKPKSIPVKADTTLWDQTKGTVQAFVFDSKEVVIRANAEPARKAIENVRKWLAGLKDKTIRVAGVNAQGGLTMATGGTVYGPTRALIGEAGPEAVVPLRRPLHMVDPSVRALSAIAQGLKPPAMASGGIVSGRSAPAVIIGEGAVQVQTAATDPGVVGRVVLHGIGDALAAAMG